MIPLRLLALGCISLAVTGSALAGCYGSLPAWQTPLLLIIGATSVWFSLCTVLGRAQAGLALLALFSVMLLGTLGLIPVFARWHHVALLPEFIAFLLRMLGLDAAAAEGNLFYHAGAWLRVVTPTTSRLGAFPVILALILYYVVLRVIGIERSGRIWSRLALMLVVCALLRLLALLMLNPDLPETGVDYSPLLFFVMLAPACLWVGPKQIIKQESEPASGWAVGGLAFVAAVFMGLVLGWDEAGSRKSGRVLFDETHGSWEPTDIRFDDTTFSRQNSYAYSDYYKLLGWYYDVARVQKGPITPERLAGTDVLIVKTPTSAFSRTEIDAIDGFVRAGGGLLLIGDHTNLFGMSTYLNRLAARFNIEFLPDDTFDIHTESQTHWRKPLLFAHPIAKAVKDFEFETSNTINVPLTSAAPMIGGGMGREDADYNNPGFFGNLHLDPRDDFGHFVQMAARRHRAGRVVAFSDSTPLSNFSVFFPGRRELALAVTEYLNCRATWASLLRPIALAGLVLSISLLLLRPGRWPAVSILAGMIFGATFASGVCTISAPNLQPEVRRPLPKKIYFVESKEHRLYPSVLSLDDEYEWLGYDTFVIAAQRLGMIPVIVTKLKSALSDADVVFLVHWDRPLARDEIEALRKFVSDGGSLLVADGLLARGSATDQVLRIFHMGTELAYERTSVQASQEIGEGTTLAASRPLLVVAGGTPELRDKQGRVVYAFRRVGKGRVGALADALTVARSQLGNRFYGAPDSEQMENMQTALHVLRNIMGQEKTTTSLQPTPAHRLKTPPSDLENGSSLPARIQNIDTESKE